MAMPNRPQPASRSLIAVVAGAALLVACTSSKKASNASSTTTTWSSTSPPATAPTSAVTEPGVSTTVAAPPVATGFSPDSVTFVSLKEGWALGTNCSTCPLAIVHTTDSGRTWTSIPAPPANPNLQTFLPDKIRFATPDDGWVYGDVGLWSTHDGGAHWAQPAQPAGLGPGPFDLEASAGTVYAVNMNNNDMFDIETSPVGHDGWTLTGSSLPVGAGPIPQIQMVLHGSSGWIVENDRIVVAGERLQSGHWSEWTPPCTKAAGEALLSASASAAVHLVAYCPPSDYATSPPGSVGLYFSTDGDTFGAPVTLPAALTRSGPLASASPSQATLAAPASDGKGQLESTFDGGRTWTVVTATASNAWTDLGFTSSSQGVAVQRRLDSSPGALYMTFDGGHSWRQVNF